MLMYSNPVNMCLKWSWRFSICTHNVITREQNDREAVKEDDPIETTALILVILSGQISRNFLKIASAFGLFTFVCCQIFFVFDYWMIPSPPPLSNHNAWFSLKVMSRTLTCQCRISVFMTVAWSTLSEKQLHESNKTFQPFLSMFSCFHSQLIIAMFRFCAFLGIMESQFWKENFRADLFELHSNIETWIHFWKASIIRPFKKKES